MISPILFMTISSFLSIKLACVNELTVVGVTSDTLNNIPTQLNQMSRDLTARQDIATSTHRAHLIQNTTALTAVETRMTQLGSGFTTMQATVQEAMQRGSADAATGQQEIMGVLGQILAQVSITNQQRPNSQPLQAPIRSELQICQELVDLITQLFSFVSDSHLQGRAGPRASQHITDLLRSTVELIRLDRYQESFQDSHLQDGSCLRCCKRKFGQVRDSLNTVYASLLSTRNIAVNDMGKPRFPRQIS